MFRLHAVKKEFPELTDKQRKAMIEIALEYPTHNYSFRLRRSPSNAHSLDIYLIDSIGQASDRPMYSSTIRDYADRYDLRQRQQGLEVVTFEIMS